VSVLGILLPGHAALRNEIFHSALAQFPVIGTRIGSKAGIHQLTGTWLRAAIGAGGALWAGLGVAQAAQRAMNVVWDIPRAEWPNFIFRRLRAVLMLVILGTIFVISTFASGIGSSGALPSGLLNAASFAASLLLNLVLFTLAFQVLTARDLKWRHVLPGAGAAAVAWTVLQVLGGYYVTHEVRSAGNVYGTFALVIGLLVWISLGAQVTLYGAEINVVWFRRLWPRSMVQPPINEGDCKVYRAIAERARMRPEVEVTVSFTAQHGQADARAGGTRRQPEPGRLGHLYRVTTLNHDPVVSVRL
jgi:membrane protein